MSVPPIDFCNAKSFLVSQTQLMLSFFKRFLHSLFHHGPLKSVYKLSGGVLQSCLWRSNRGPTWCLYKYIRNYINEYFIYCLLGFYPYVLSIGRRYLRFYVRSRLGLCLMSIYWKICDRFVLFTTSDSKVICLKWKCWYFLWLLRYEVFYSSYFCNDKGIK